MLLLPLLSRGSAAASAALAFLLVLSVALAAELKVDISNSGRPLAEGLDPAFTDWATTQSWFTGGNMTTRTFGDVTVKFTRVGAVGTALQTGYWKAGVQSTTYNVKLTGDGLKVNGGDTGAQIEVRLTGLTAGEHTLLLYLNNWDSPTTLPAPLDIFVDGTQVINDLPVTSQVTDNNLATTAYLNFTAVAGQDVVVLVQAETSGTNPTKNVHINGFEIDAPNAAAKANNPAPDNADEHANADSGSITLSWGTATKGAASHQVYFGTSELAVKNATTASPEFKGTQTANTYPVSGINTHLTYYWRIDEIAANGSTTKGNLWYFRPRRLAFPEAEGYGRFARGGRGGVVVHVTNLNDSGPGSLRDAVLGDYGPRTVVFEVSGLITLLDDIIISGNQPYVTIAGQTAPGKGICVKRNQLAMSGARDCIFRFMRVLVGKDNGETQNATGMAGVDHSIMDHCSLGWGIDEGLSTRSGKNLTFQRCSLSEALNVAGHQNYPAGTAHGYAASVGGDIASLHHNLLAHNEGRNWSMAGGLDGAGYYAGKLDIFNNVVYNWGGRTTDGGAQQVNFVSNYYKVGASSNKFTALNPQYGGFPGTQQYYMAGNVMPGKFTEANQAAGLSIGTENGGTIPQNSTPPYSATVNAPFFPSYATIHTATGAYKQVLSDVGCTLPMVDNRDARIVGETLDGTYTYTGSVSGKKGLPDTTNDVGGWEDYGNATRPPDWDTDGDGMPDWWETIKGLNPNSQAGNFAESNADSDGNGYTNLEEYLNWMALPHVDCNGSATVDVDLPVLSRGYSKTTPVYTLSAPVNGTVTLIAGNKARFTASTSTNALGKFTFTVTDSAGDSMTQSVGVRVLGAAAPVLPEVTLAATDASAGELGPDQSIVFTVTRTGATTSALTVPLVASGSATAGQDYTGFSGSVTIPAGQTSVLLTLSALADSNAEGTESITVTLDSSSVFNLGTPSSASASVADSPAQSFYYSAIADPAKRGPADDPDGDGIPNLLEYFMGTGPDSSSSGGSVTIKDPAAFTVTYQRAKGITDVSASLEWSPDLANWYTSGQSDGTRSITFVETVSPGAGNTPDTVEAATSISGQTAARLFIRLHVQTP